MYDIVMTGLPAGARLRAEKPLTSKDFYDIAVRLAVTPVRARKLGFVSAKPATVRQPVETRWNGTETRNVAEPGDLIAANLGPDRKLLRDRDGNANIYVIKAAVFPTLYEPVGDETAGDTSYGPIYRALGRVEAIALPSGFEIAAPWGEIQRADAGYLLLNGSEVYGNAKGSFETTYTVEP